MEDLQDIKKIEEDYSKKRLDGLAELPELQMHIDPEVEYKSFQEQQTWAPIDEENNQWLSVYMLLARSLITISQIKDGVPNKEALENACLGEAEEFMMESLYEVGYDPLSAARIYRKKNLPKTLTTSWSEEEIALFIRGIVRYGKNFHKIRKNLLPGKDTDSIVEYYYKWKKTKSAQAARKRRNSRFYKAKPRTTVKTEKLVINAPSVAGKMVTRSTRRRTIAGKEIMPAILLDAATRPRRNGKSLPGDSNKSVVVSDLVNNLKI
ncbi:arginine-glutamic acid dipeptide repeats protein [Cephus cinctus]|uniref:Arginine-glutamic acid dipeptide repeats protein n=1 Tax=Cephus cinctus TaxID=211228 RepID=A0AAJ7FEI3_CEPCN|nr:arginine-glutamic acid dipeptide repeats protein [Cephus cinctus]